MNEMLKAQSVKQGLAYDSTINPLEHIQGFVKTYSIDTSILLNPDLTSYKTFNQFFYRKLRSDARPIAEPENNLCISSAADSRLTVFQTVEKATEFWIKVRPLLLFLPCSSLLLPVTNNEIDNVDKNRENNSLSQIYYKILN